MEYVFDVEEYMFFLKTELIPRFNRAIEFKISKEKLISFLVTGTLKLIRIYDRSSVPFLRIAPIHRNLEEDYEY